MSITKKKSTTAKKTITKIRKKPVNIETSEKYRVIEDYINSDLTTQQIADKYSTSAKAVNLAVTRHYKTLRNIKETKFLMSGAAKAANPSKQMSATTKTMYQSLFADDGINGEFLSRLSLPDELVLTQWEMEFCYNWIYCSSDSEALKKSDLTVGLIPKERGRKVDGVDRERSGFDRSCRMRSLFLRRKPNVASMIKEIQKDNLKAEGIDKEFIQTELVREIQELREDKELRSRQLLSKNLEILGKTIPGAFSEKIEISTIDPNAALQELIELAEVSAKILPAGSQVDEVWESTD